MNAVKRTTKQLKNINSVMKFGLLLVTFLSISKLRIYIIQIVETGNKFLHRLKCKTDDSVLITN